jgi:hypothetical protein
MASLKSAEGYRSYYQDISGHAAITATTNDTTLVTGKPSHTIYIQHIVFFVTTDAAQSVSFEDSNSTPKQIAEIPASPGDSTRWDFPFGDAGVPLTEGMNFVMNVSAPGLAGHVEWEGYMKPTSPIVA